MDQSSLPRADSQDVLYALLLGLLLVIAATGAGVVSQTVWVGAGRTHPIDAVRHITVVSALAGAALFVALGFACLVIERLTYQARVVGRFLRRCIAKEILEDLDENVKVCAEKLWPVIREGSWVDDQPENRSRENPFRRMKLKDGKSLGDYRDQWTRAEEAMDALNGIAAETGSPHALRFYEFKLRRRAVWGASRSAVLVGFAVGADIRFFMPCPWRGRSISLTRPYGWRLA